MPDFANVYKYPFFTFKQSYVSTFRKLFLLLSFTYAVITFLIYYLVFEKYFQRKKLSVIN